MFLKPGDLPAHRALGDVQLLTGTGEVATLSRDQKSMQRGKWR